MCLRYSISSSICISAFASISHCSFLRLHAAFVIKQFMAMNSFSAPSYRKAWVYFARLPFLEAYVESPSRSSRRFIALIVDLMHVSQGFLFIFSSPGLAAVFARKY